MADLDAHTAFTYDLPAHRIAQRPVVPYDQAKMLVIDKNSKTLKEERFIDLPKYLTKNDLLVINNTRVIPARFFGTFDGGTAKVEVLLLKNLGDDRWSCLGKPLKKFKPGVRLHLGDVLFAEVLARHSEHEVELHFFSKNRAESVSMLIAKHGCMPIPPYIRGGLGDTKDIEDYQTCFAKIEGSIAAPTASLHLTPKLLDDIRNVGCEIEVITMHLGMASFLPVLVDDGTSSQVRPPGAEQFIFSKAVLDKVKVTKERGGRVVAVGTSVVRALESMFSVTSPLQEGEIGQTELFIQPGYKFCVVDAMVTNFHQPRTSHLLLVQAFMARELLAKSYAYALEHEFRFLSYGDGMFIV